MPQGQEGLRSVLQSWLHGVLLVNCGLSALSAAFHFALKIIQYLSSKSMIQAPGCPWSICGMFEYHRWNYVGFPEELKFPQSDAAATGILIATLLNQLFTTLAYFGYIIPYSPTFLLLTGRLETQSQDGFRRLSA